MKRYQYREVDVRTGKQTGRETEIEAATDEQALSALFAWIRTNGRNGRTTQAGNQSAWRLTEVRA